MPPSATHGECSYSAPKRARRTGLVELQAPVASSASGTSSKASTSTSPRSVIFSDGMTDSARNDSVMNGASIATPCSRSSACSASRRLGDVSSGLVARAARRSAAPARRAPRRRGRRPGRRRAPAPRDRAQRHVGVVHAHDDEVVRVVRDRRGERAAAQPEPAHQPEPDAPRARGGARSRRSSPGRAPGRRPRGRPRRAACSSPAPVISWPGCDLDHPHPRRRARDRERGASPAPSASCRAAPWTPAPRRILRLAPVLEHQRRVEARQVVEQHEVGHVAGRDRPAIAAARAPARRAAWPSPARPRARRPRRRRSGTSGRCGPRR